MSDTYHTYDRETGQPVVVKVPHANVIGNMFTLRRLRREIEIGQMLDHPNIQRLIAGGYFGDDNRPYMVMEYVEGQNLRKYLEERKRLAIDEAVHLVCQLLEALEHCHGLGIIHRDLKPENVLITPDGQVKLMDFGISLLLGARRVTFTQLANPMGTPDYVSPEQVSGMATDERSDIYAMGILLYEMIAGSVPFEGENPLSVVAQRVMRDPPHIRAVCPEVSRQLDHVVYKASRLDPNLRYPTAAEMRYDLEHLDQITLTEPVYSFTSPASEERLGASRRTWLTILALLVVLAALLGAAAILLQYAPLP
jgi:serine/threonine-protein kinase